MCQAKPTFNAAQQCVQRTAGSLRVLQAGFWLRVFPALRLLPTPAPCPPLTPAVRKTRGFPSAVGFLKFGLANYLVLQMVDFIGLGSVGEGVFFKMITVD